MDAVIVDFAEASGAAKARKAAELVMQLFPVTQTSRANPDGGVTIRTELRAWFGTYSCEMTFHLPRRT